MVDIEMGGFKTDNEEEKENDEDYDEENEDIRGFSKDYFTKLKERNDKTPLLKAYELQKKAKNIKEIEESLNKIKYYKEKKEKEKEINYIKGATENEKELEKIQNEKYQKEYINKLSKNMQWDEFTSKLNNKDTSDQFKINDYTEVDTYKDKPYGSETINDAIWSLKAKERVLNHLNKAKNKYKEYKEILDKNKFNLKLGEKGYFNLFNNKLKNKDKKIIYENNEIKKREYDNQEKTDWQEIHKDEFQRFRNKNKNLSLEQAKIKYKNEEEKQYNKYRLEDKINERKEEKNKRQRITKKQKEEIKSAMNFATETGMFPKEYHQRQYSPLNDKIDEILNKYEYNPNDENWKSKIPKEELDRIDKIRNTNEKIADKLREEEERYIKKHYNPKWNDDYEGNKAEMKSIKDRQKKEKQYWEIKKLKEAHPSNIIMKDKPSINSIKIKQINEKIKEEYPSNIIMKDRPSINSIKIKQINENLKRRIAQSKNIKEIQDKIKQEDNNKKEEYKKKWNEKYSAFENTLENLTYKGSDKAYKPETLTLAGAIEQINRQNEKNELQKKYIQDIITKKQLEKLKKIQLYNEIKKRNKTIKKIKNKNKRNKRGKTIKHSNLLKMLQN